MPAGYEYGNARLRARRSHLFKEPQYHALLDKATVEELIAALAETRYQEEIEAALTRGHNLGTIFTALRNNLTSALRQARSFYEAEPGLLVDLLLQRWDRHNLLVILRGQSQEAAAERVLSELIPVGKLDEVALRELARQPGLRATIDLMRTWQLPYAALLSTLGPTPDLDQLELALNRLHYTTMLEMLDKRYVATTGDMESPVPKRQRRIPPDGNRALLLDWIHTEIDCRNIGITLRIARQPELISMIQHRYQSDDVRPLFIEPGGYLPAKRLLDLITERGGVEAVVRGLESTPYGAALQHGWQQLQLYAGGIAAFERALERWQAQRVAALMRNDPLSMAVPIAYITGKETEIANIRLIAQAVALQMPRAQVEQNLIIL